MEVTLYCHPLLSPKPSRTSWSQPLLHFFMYSSRDTFMPLQTYIYIFFLIIQNNNIYTQCPTLCFLHLIYSGDHRSIKNFFKETCLILRWAGPRKNGLRYSVRRCCLETAAVPASCTGPKRAGVWLLEAARENAGRCAHHSISAGSPLAL